MRRRAVSLVLALIANLLLILALLTLNGPPGQRSQSKGPVLLDLSPPAEEAAPTAKPQKLPTPEKAQEKPPPPAPVPPVEHPPVPSLNPLPYYIPLTKEQFVAADIGRFPKRAAPSQGSQSAPGDSERVGTAPDGEPLYAAEWYRRPTHAELGAYLPARMPREGGWGLIACKTVPDYRVDDCVELGNSPPGSHLAGAVRQAAWQFRVRPPRVGGKELVGTWVRIRIDYSNAPEPQQQ